MIEQLALIPTEPRPTDRQQLVLEAVGRAGPDGLASDEAGALLCQIRGSHTTDTRCRWCAVSGRDVLNALRAKHLVRYRRATRLRAAGWVVSDSRDDTPSGMLRPDQELPY